MIALFMISIILGVFCAVDNDVAGAVICGAAMIAFAIMSR